MRNGAPCVCHVGFKLKICFFPPLIFCEESASGCVILSPHDSASFLTVFQPSVYSLISWLLGLQVYNFSCQLFCDQDGERRCHVDSRGCVCCILRRMLLQASRESHRRFLRVLRVFIYQLQELPRRQDLAGDRWLLLVVGQQTSQQGLRLSLFL